MIEHGGGKESAFAKFLRRWCCRGASTAARRPRPPTAPHGRSRAAHAQRIQQHELARRIGEMIIAAQHLGDSHRRVIDGVAKEERRRAVVAPNDEIADIAR